MDVRRGGRQILLHGLTLVLAGLLWGLIVPHTPYPRLALGAHIQLVFNGLLLIVMASLILNFDHRIGPKSILVMLLSAWLIWAMALSEVANSWWGTSKMLPIAAHEAGATGALPWQEGIVMLTHIGAGLSLIAAWALLLLGIARGSAGSTGQRDISRPG
jgi:(hydroxyamino)benzene mutase